MSIWPTQPSPWTTPAEIGDCGLCGEPRAPGRYVCAAHAMKIDSTADELRQNGADWQAHKPPKGRPGKRERREQREAA